ncbi:MAG: alkaline phosphatase D family protein [Verrucomicrobiota bacterium]
MKTIQKSASCFTIRLLLILITLLSTGSADPVYVEPTESSVPRDVRKGSLEMDTWIMDNYGLAQNDRRDLYLGAREYLSASRDARLSDSEVVSMAQDMGISLISGPLLGDLTTEGVSIWMRPSIADDLTILVIGENEDPKYYPVMVEQLGRPVRTQIDNLKEASSYTYAIVASDSEVVARGSFKTAPRNDTDSQLRITFGADFHKIGLHNPNLFSQISRRDPLAMFFYGDIAADGRRSNFNMIEADYLLRDTSGPWANFVANTPVYTSWDDWDYFANDRSGLDRHITAEIRQNLREIWNANWNSPVERPRREGIFFKTRLGPVEYFMLDTRSCRETGRKGGFRSFLGEEQHEWLKLGLLGSTAPFKVISSGTMWSDYVSDGKDSWGVWDKEGREDIFSFIEEKGIGGVLLVSGDRHGARGFRIPRKNDFGFFEFGVGSLGGIKGPDALVKDCSEQFFGYTGSEIIAFGEFTFDPGRPDPEVTFRLISDHGVILEEVKISLSQITPP